MQKLTIDPSVLGSKIDSGFIVLDEIKEVIDKCIKQKIKHTIL